MGPNNNDTVENAEVQFCIRGLPKPNFAALSVSRDGLFSSSFQKHFQPLFFHNIFKVQNIQLL